MFCYRKSNCILERLFIRSNVIMKQLLYLSTVLYFFFFASCESNSLSKISTETDYNKEIYYIDKDSLKQGEYVELTLEGDTISKTFYKDNKLHGERKIYDEKGRLKILETYREGEYHGPEYTYHENGNIHTKGNFNNGNLDSIFYVYYDTGELHEKVTIQNNEENGPFEEYYKNGQVHWKGQFINGPNEIGLLLEYDNQGELIQKMDCITYMGDYICQTIWKKGVGDIKPKLEYDE